MLTDREKELLQIIEKLDEERGFPPTIREIGEAAGIRSTNGVRYFLKRLEAKGHINLSQGHSRGIKLMHPRSNGASPAPRLVPLRGASNAEPLYVPLLGRVAAGQPVLSDENIEDRVLLDPSFAGHGTVFALRVRGDSMKDVGILDRDTIIVRQQREARNGEIVVALVDGEATVKTFRRFRDKVVLEPANEAFSPIEVESGQDLEIVGKVVSVLRRLE